MVDTVDFCLFHNLKRNEIHRKNLAMPDALLCGVYSVNDLVGVFSGGNSNKVLD